MRGWSPLVTKLNKQMNMAVQISSSTTDYEPNDVLKCLICFELCEDPWQHEKCGRLFCRKCVEDYGREKPCPNCREKRPKYFEDNRSKLCGLYIVKTDTRQIQED